VPGGLVTVGITDDDSTLTGPAVVVASGTIDQGFWDRHR
jgi:diaminopimelate epimerase